MFLHSILPFLIFLKLFYHLYILKKNNKIRYLSKNNQNIRRLVLISEIFPRSKILIPFRDPLQQAFSLYSQHMKFVKEQNKKQKFRNKLMKKVQELEYRSVA